MVDVLHAALTGLLQVLVWPAFGFMLLGVGIGYVVGVLPGLGGPAALALVLPFVFSMDVVDALALLIGLATVTVTAGDMTSILLGIPGEATSTAILIDGHAMTSRGEGGRAAGAALVSSLVGAAFGAAALAALLPIVQPLLKSVESPELAMLALLGVSLVIPLSTRAPLKGLVAGSAGLFLATVGVDASTGVPRFTFGQLFLFDGIGMLPAALGLFAIPEALALVSSKGIKDHDAGGAGVTAGMREVIHHWRLVLRCGLLGTGIGILPGVGATVSQWLAYGHAAQCAARRERFGTGEIEGVIAPGAASTATFGGALIPTLALGIPGSVSSAFILSAITLKGLTPGPSFLLPEGNGGHLALAFSMAWLIVGANACAVVLGLLFLNRLAGLARIRPTRLFSAVILCILLGAVAEKRAVGDLAVVAVSGAVGVAMVRLDWPRAPLLLGLILGPMFERRLLLSNAAFGSQWMLRPAVLGMAVLLLIVLLRSFRAPPVASLRSRSSGRVDLRFDLAAGGILLLTAVAGLWHSRQIAGVAAVLPRLLLAGVAVLSLLHVAGTLRRIRRPLRRAPHEADAPPVETRALAAIGWLALFACGVWLLGFVVGGCLCSAMFLRLVSRESWRGVALMTTTQGLVVHLLGAYAMPSAGGGLLWASLL